MHTLENVVLLGNCNNTFLYNLFGAIVIHFMKYHSIATQVQVDGQKIHQDGALLPNEQRIVMFSSGAYLANINHRFVALQSMHR